IEVQVVPISQNRAAHIDACTLETNRLLFEKIISYTWSMGANYLRRGNVTNGRPLFILGRARNGLSAQGRDERNARESQSIFLFKLFPKSRCRSARRFLTGPMG